MKVIVCIDDNNGMMFNKRRVSQDAVVRADILAMVKKLEMNSYSAKQFEMCDKIIVNDNVPVKSDNWQFIEDNTLLNYQDEIDEIVIYYWNRRYPSDLQLEIDLALFNRVEVGEFIGKSHEKIKKETYRK